MPQTQVVGTWHYKTGKIKQTKVSGANSHRNHEKSKMTKLVTPVYVSIQKPVIDSFEPFTGMPLAYHLKELQTCGLIKILNPDVLTTSIAMLRWTHLDLAGPRVLLLICLKTGWRRGPWCSQDQHTLGPWGSVHLETSQTWHSPWSFAHPSAEVLVPRWSRPPAPLSPRHDRMMP